MFKSKDESYFPPSLPFDVQIFRKLEDQRQQYNALAKKKRTLKNSSK